jgi:hypothetical protein
MGTLPCIVPKVAYKKTDKAKKLKIVLFTKQISGI